MAGEDTLPFPEWRRVIFEGNHESMMVETIRKPLTAWCSLTAATKTLYSYGHPSSGKCTGVTSFPIIRESSSGACRLPRTRFRLFFCDKQRVYVHACVG